MEQFASSRETVIIFFIRIDYFNGLGTEGQDLFVSLVHMCPPYVSGHCGEDALQVSHKSFYSYISPVC